MNSRIQVISIRPAAEESEVAVITTALSAMWPHPTKRSHIQRDSSWRFSGRANRGRVVRAVEI
jgi:hypothetical protein